MSMIVDPNLNSPANVDAAIEFRDDYKSFKKRVRKLIDCE